MFCRMAIVLMTERAAPVDRAPRRTWRRCRAAGRARRAGGRARRRGAGAPRPRRGEYARSGGFAVTGRSSSRQGSDALRRVPSSGVARTVSGEASGERHEHGEREERRLVARRPRLVGRVRTRRGHARLGRPPRHTFAARRGRRCRGRRCSSLRQGELGELLGPVVGGAAQEAAARAELAKTLYIRRIACGPRPARSAASSMTAFIAGRASGSA